MSHSDGWRPPKRETITRKEPHPNGQPWQWGYDAARDGYSIIINPFRPDSPSGHKWLEGFAEGQKEKTA